MKRTQVAEAGWRIVAGVLLVVFAGAVTAGADVTIKRHSTFKGLGGIMNSEINGVESIAGDKSATESETRMTNAVMKVFAGKAVKTTSVVRLDKGLWWDINHQDKSYTEMTLAEMRAMMDSLGQMFGGGMQGGQQKPAFDTTKMTFSPPTFEVKQTGQKAVIAGRDCDESILTMTTEGTDKKSGEKMKLIVTMEMMLAQNVPGAAEQEAFGRKMAEALGMTVDRNAQSMMGMLKAYGIDPKELAVQAEKMKGFPMRTVMKFSMGGAAAKSEATAQRGTGDQPEEAPAAAQEENKESSTSKSSVTKKALGGLFGKKDKGKETSAKESAKSSKAAEPQDNSMFSLTTEVTEISTGSVTAERFELPAGYKKEKNRPPKK